MKIKELSIYGYGKWVDQSFPLSSDLHVFYGENEAGKSTLQSFIQSVLFGFPTRHSSSLRYEPKESSRYGGKLRVEDTPLGEVMIERTHGKATGDVTIQLANGEGATSDYLETILYGIDRELYQSVFSFRLQDLENVEKLTQGQLHRYFLSAGALGSEKFLEEADQLEKQASKLYKPTGRVPVINQKLQIVEEKRQQLNQAKEKNEQYLEVINELEKTNRLLSDIKQSIQKWDEKRQKMGSVEREWHGVKESRKLEEEIQKLDLPELAEDGLYSLNRINQERETIQGKIHRQQEKINNVRVEHQPSKAFLVYQEKKKSINELKQWLPSIQQNIQEKHFALKEQKRLEESLAKEKIQEGLLPDQAVPCDWSPDDIAEWEEQWETYSAEENDITQELANISYALSTNVSSVDEIEKDLWESEDYRKEKAFHNKDQPEHAFKAYARGGVFLGLVMGLFGGLLLDGVFSWVAGLIGLAISVFSVFVSKNQKKKGDSSFSYEEFIQQQELRKQWKKQLAQIDTLEEEKRKKQERKEQVLSKRIEIEQAFEKWKKQNGLPPVLSLKNSTQKYSLFQEINRKEQKWEGQKKVVERLEEQVREVASSLNFLDELFPHTNQVERKVDYFVHFLQTVSKEEELQKEYVEKSQEIGRTIKQLMQQEKELLNEKRSLLKNAEVDSEEMFREYYALFQKKKEKQERLKAMRRNQPTVEVEKYANLEQVKEKIQNSEETIKQLKAEEANCMEKKISLQIEQQKLEEGGEYAALLQDFENERSELQTLVDEWVSKKIAAVMIKHTLNEAIQDRLPKVIEDAETYFSYLTGEKYKKIRVTKDRVTVVNHKGDHFRAEELSRGTAEPLYVSLRLAFIKNSQDIVSLPIIVDDGFVNFDQKRKKKMYHLLKEISQFSQVLFFSFDAESYQGLNPEQVTMLQ